MKYSFLVVITLLSFSCNKKSACDGFVGTYDDRGKKLVIEKQKAAYVLKEENSLLSCNCNSKGELEIMGTQGIVTIQLSESGGKQTFCFAEDSLQEDCIYKTEF